MKSYLPPALTVLAFTPEVAVAAELEGSKTTNDGELAW